MNLQQEVKLRGWGGQRSDVQINRRNNGSVYVTFTCESGYGYPTLELRDLKRVVEQAEQMERDAEMRR